MERPVMMQDAGSLDVPEQQAQRDRRLERAHDSDHRADNPRTGATLIGTFWNVFEHAA
jgi:hypothetical protein